MDVRRDSRIHTEARRDVPEATVMTVALPETPHLVWSSVGWSGTVGLDLKGELRNRFNLISQERVNICEQNSENLMKIG